MIGDKLTEIVMFKIQPHLLDGTDHYNRVYEILQDEFHNLEAKLDYLRTQNQKHVSGILKLECLEAAGVDSWDGYEEAMTMYREGL